MMCVGVKLCEVYEAAVLTVRDERPQLVDKLTKSAGFVVTFAQSLPLLDTLVEFIFRLEKRLELF